MEKTLYKAFYPQQRTILRFDEGRAIIYPQETVIEDFDWGEQNGIDDGEEHKGTAYQYEGTETDGGYVVDCPDINDVHDVANAIVRTHYSLSEELALRRHYINDPEKYADDWKAYSDFADAAADKARAWLGVTA